MVSVDVKPQVSHKGETGSDDSAQVLTRSFALSRLGVEPTVAELSGSPAKRANHLATPQGLGPWLWPLL